MKDIQQLILEDLSMESGVPGSERCQHGRAGWEWCHWCDQASTAATRREAEAKIAPKRNKLREEVYECIRDHGPITDEQIATLTKMNPSTSRPRRLELEKAGRIEAAGVSRTTAGRRAVAWRVVPEG
jgi:hypothetical protein